MLLTKLLTPCKSTPKATPKKTKYDHSGIGALMGDPYNHTIESNKR